MRLRARSGVAAIVAIFAMLCQSIMPTIVYQQAAGNPMLLSAVAQAIGIRSPGANALTHHHEHPADSTQARPMRERPTQCALCLADMILAGIPTLPFHVLPIPLGFYHSYFVFVTAFFPVALGMSPARGPPLSCMSQSFPAPCNG